MDIHKRLSLLDFGSKRPWNSTHNSPLGHRVALTTSLLPHRTTSALCELLHCNMHVVCKNMFWLGFICILPNTVFQNLTCYKTARASLWQLLGFARTGEKSQVKSCSCRWTEDAYSRGVLLKSRRPCPPNFHLLKVTHQSFPNNIRGSLATEVSEVLCMHHLCQSEKCPDSH